MNGRILADAFLANSRALIRSTDQNPFHRRSAMTRGVRYCLSNVCQLMRCAYKSILIRSMPALRSQTKAPTPLLSDINIGVDVHLEHAAGIRECTICRSLNIMAGKYSAGVGGALLAAAIFTIMITNIAGAGATVGPTQARMAGRRQL